jgi:endonuclease III
VEKKEKREGGLQSSGALRERMSAVYEILSPLWPDAKPLLDFSSCFELLCAVVLSAQCTDEQVNKVTPGLFKRWPDAAALAGAGLEEVEACIHSVGFYRSKARHLVAAAAKMVGEFGAEVPATMEGLLSLPGVGRKTANLVISACSDEPGIIVDTHVLRVCLRLGFESKPDAGVIEKRIAATMPRASWTRFSHALNRHGKHVCSARKPRCQDEAAVEPCPLQGLCPRIGLPMAGRAKRGTGPGSRRKETG